jgi:hypothetical protein
MAYLLIDEITATPISELLEAPLGYDTELFATFAADAGMQPNIVKQSASARDNIRFITSSAFLLKFHSSTTH